jgi:hypothetical protein
MSLIALFYWHRVCISKTAGAVGIGFTLLALCGTPIND